MRYRRWDMVCLSRWAFVCWGWRLGGGRRCKEKWSEQTVDVLGALSALKTLRSQ